MNEAAHDQGRGWDRPAASRSVSWAWKNWRDMTDEDKSNIQAHLSTFQKKEDADGYRVYLRDHCDVPATWLGISQK